MSAVAVDARYLFMLVSLSFFTMTLKLNEITKIKSRYKMSCVMV